MSKFDKFLKTLKEDKTEEKLDEAFTRQHFQKIADVIKKNESKENLVAALCDMFKADNPNFKEDLFRKACGL